MADQKTNEKREYIRADLTTRVRIQPISRQEFERIKSMQTVGLPDGVCADEPDTPDAPLGYLLERLIRLEEKVDKILSKLDPEHRSDEGVTYGTAKNVSGVGVSLSLSEEMDVGQLVLISLSVPGFSIGFLQAYGEIVRVSKSGGTFDTSIKFLIISETEREKLISYAFYKQRQTIRSSAVAREKEQE